MGMNLPIRRIVFLQTIKFDGVKERSLTASEVKQIAGRAGRYGLYDTGLVTSYYDYWLIENLLSQRVPNIKKAMISIPSEFLEKDGKVSRYLSCGIRSLPPISMIRGIFQRRSRWQKHLRISVTTGR